MPRSLGLAEHLERATVEMSFGEGAGCGQVDLGLRPISELLEGAARFQRFDPFGPARGQDTCEWVGVAKEGAQEDSRANRTHSPEGVCGEASLRLGSMVDRVGDGGGGGGVAQGQQSQGPAESRQTPSARCALAQSRQRRGLAAQSEGQRREGRGVVVSPPGEVGERRDA